MTINSDRKKKANTAAFIVGVSLGVSLLTVLVAVFLKRRCQEILIPLALDRGQTYTFIPPRPISLAGEETKKNVSQTEKRLPLEIQARPSVFHRREAGSVIVTTLPGATCEISARYSTGSAPASLTTGQITVGPSGQHRWVWEIGTSGVYVDVTIEAVKEGYNRQVSQMRVDITG